MEAPNRLVATEDSMCVTTRADCNSIPIRYTPPSTPAHRESFIERLSFSFPRHLSRRGPTRNMGLAYLVHSSSGYSVENLGMSVLESAFPHNCLCERTKCTDML